MVLPFGSMVFEPHVSSDDLEAYSLGLSNLSIAGRLAVVIGGGMPVAAIRPAPISRQQASCSAPPNSRLPDMPDVAFGMMLIAGGVLVKALYAAESQKVQRLKSERMSRALRCYVQAVKGEQANAARPRLVA